MTQPVMSDAVGVSFAREATAGTQPTTGWRKLQVNPGGIQNFRRQNIVVGRRILSGNLTPEAGDVVAYDSSPKLQLDVTKDMWDLFRELAFRSSTKQGGGTGTAQFFPTAVTAGSPNTWTVAAGGALAAGRLVRYRNAANPANNGVYLVAGTSAAGHVDTATALVTETPLAISVLEVIGVQGASGDIQIDANGDIVATTLDLTTLGLVNGQMIGVGDLTSGAAFGFATARNGYATIKGPITAGKIPLLWRSWTLTGADTGSGKTIRLLFHTANQNVTIDPTGANGYLPEPTCSFELSKPGSGGGTDYTYFNGNALGMLKLTMPLEGKLTAEIDMIGMTVGNPTSSRSSGPSTAPDAVGAGPHTTSAKLLDLRLMKKSDESLIALDINDWDVSYSNEAKALKAQATPGAIGHLFGQYTPTITISKAYVTDSALNLAVNNYTDLCMVALFKAADGTGFGLTFPLVKCKNADEAFAAGDGETVKVDLEVFRDPATGFLWTLTQFGYLP